MDVYQKFVNDRIKTKEANDGLLTDFEIWLVSFGLAPKTIFTHVANIDFSLTITFCTRMQSKPLRVCLM